MRIKSNEKNIFKNRFIIIIRIIYRNHYYCSCATDVVAEQTYPLKIWLQNENGMCKTWNVIDEDTGVNYVVVTTNRSNADYSIAITPRLNADGSLYISK